MLLAIGQLGHVVQTAAADDSDLNAHQVGLLYRVVVAEAHGWNDPGLPIFFADVPGRN